MNKHKWIAILMFPFLAIGGWGLADLYTKKDSKSTNIYRIPTSENKCHLSEDKCQVLHNQISFELSLAQSEGSTAPSLEVFTNRDVAGVMMELLDQNGQSILAADRMQLQNDARHWYRDLGSLPSGHYQLRLVISVKRATFLTEMPVWL